MFSLFNDKQFFFSYYFFLLSSFSSTSCMNINFSNGNVAKLSPSAESWQRWWLHCVPVMCNEYKLRGKIEPCHLSVHRRAASLTDTRRHPHMHQHTLQVASACEEIADCGRIESEPFWELSVLAVRTVNFLCRSDLSGYMDLCVCVLWSIHEFVSCLFITPFRNVFGAQLCLLNFILILWSNLINKTH